VVENGLNRWPKRYTPFPDVLQASGYATALFGKAGVMPVPNSLRAAEAGSWVLEQMRAAPHERRAAGTSQHAFLETFLVNKTLAWIAARAQGAPPPPSSAAPWFVWLSMLSPHGPNTVPAEWRNPWQRAAAGAARASALPPGDPPRAGDWALLPTQTKKLLGLEDPRSLLANGGLSAEALEDLKRRYYAQVCPSKENCACPRLRFGVLHALPSPIYTWIL
jgi:arylsulfatase A-like enzyme